MASSPPILPSSMEEENATTPSSSSMIDNNHNNLDDELVSDMIIPDNEDYNSDGIIDEDGSDSDTNYGNNNENTIFLSTFQPQRQQQQSLSSINYTSNLINNTETTLSSNIPDESMIPIILPSRSNTGMTTTNELTFECHICLESISFTNQWIHNDELPCTCPESMYICRTCMIGNICTAIQEEKIPKLVCCGTVLSSTIMNTLLLDICPLCYDSNIKQCTNEINNTNPLVSTNCSLQHTCCQKCLINSITYRLKLKNTFNPPGCFRYIECSYEYKDNYLTNHYSTLIPNYTVLRSEWLMHQIFMLQQGLSEVGLSKKCTYSQCNGFIKASLDDINQLNQGQPVNKRCNECFIMYCFHCLSPCHSGSTCTEMVNTKNKWYKFLQYLINTDKPNNQTDNTENTVVNFTKENNMDITSIMNAAKFTLQKIEIYVMMKVIFEKKYRRVYYVVVLVVIV